MRKVYKLFGFIPVWIIVTTYTDEAYKEMSLRFRKELDDAVAKQRSGR